VVAPFYTFFFGLMVGDMAYGLLLVLGTLLALKLFKLSEGTKQFMRLFMCLGFGTLVGGALYGGFFGYAVFTPITMPDGTKKAILDSSLDIVTMLAASVVLGVVHVLFGIGVKGYMLLKDGKPLDALFDSVFWIITLIGGIGYILALSGMLPPPYSEWAKWAFIAGVVGLALTQGRSSPSIAGKLGNGLYAVYGISSYVGDFVSYTRIAALALSGAYIAFSFNLMVDMFPGWSKIVVGGFVFIVGQALNFGLAALGAYVHTCRLMYVEFFGKFYEGGGKPYRPLRLINKFVKVEK
jgi:V/A-type H+-transporting ATPase subunit I